MILYVIQAHTNPQQLAKLIDLLNCNGNKIIINMDPKAQLDLTPVIEALERSDRVELVLRTGLPLTWAGMSQVFTYLEVFRFALRWNAHWQYVINLSGECIPLVNHEKIISFLRERSGEGKRAHMSFFGPPMRPDFFHLMDYGEEVSHEAASTEVKFYDRVPALIQTPLQAIFRDRQVDPLHNWDLRGSLHVSDLMLAKRLVIRKLLPFEAERRRELFQQLRLSGGRAWYMFRRDALEDLLSDPMLPGVAGLLEHFLCPDELFMQTLIMNSSRFGPDQISTRNAHFRQGEPVGIRDDIFDDLFASGAFFARKINYERCPQIVNRAREIAAC